jgi:hypothetical protein
LVGLPECLDVKKPACVDPGGLG